MTVQRDTTTRQPTKLQRLIDLVAYLAKHHFPVERADIWEHVPGYVAGVDGNAQQKATVRRTFERDKDELRSLGVPIESVEQPQRFGTERVVAYRLAPGYRLPVLRLMQAERPEDRSQPEGAGDCARLALHFALSRQEADAALRGPSGACHPAGVPLCWRRPVDPPQAGPRLGARRPRRHAGALRPKSGSRCHVRTAGQPVRRPPSQEAGDLSIPCHEPTRGDEPPGPPLRSPLRTRKVVPGRPRRGPEGHPPLSRRAHEPARRQHAVAEQARLRPPVQLSPARPRGPQGLELGDRQAKPETADVLFQVPVSYWAERNDFGELVESRSCGAQVRRFQVSNRNSFLRWVLSLLGEARIVAPTDVREDFREMARSVARGYERAVDHG